MSAALACPFLNDGDNPFQGSSSSFSDDFRVSEAGTLTVSIADLPSQDSIGDFEFSLYSKAGGPSPNFWSGASYIGDLVGAGEITIPVLPGFVYAFSFNQTSGGSAAGAFGVDVNFQPDVPSTVPLPGSLVLMLSGLGLVLGLRARGPAAA